MLGQIMWVKTLDSKGNWVEKPAFRIDGQVVTQAEFKKHFRDRSLAGRQVSTSARRAAWPIRSEGMAVHPTQRETAMAIARKQGVPTYIDRVGRPVFESLAHQRAYMKIRGFHDLGKRNAGTMAPSKRFEHG